MKNVKLLDCTLRDGGRIIDCAFSDKSIREISQKLAKAKIDIVEVGFLRDPELTDYQGNSTFFTHPDQIGPLLSKQDTHALYVAFVDFGMYDFARLPAYNGTSVDGIRVGFTKKDYEAHPQEIFGCLRAVKEKGYKLFVQTVNSLAYPDLELLELVKRVNEIQPYSFGIVDTYGAMYPDDVERLYRLIDNNLEESVCIDFHSHNNFQLSFALAQEIIRLSGGERRLIIDATLAGMGKGAGNLNTEMIVDYLVRKKNYDYEFDSILDIIDEHLDAIRESHPWGYTIPSFMAGIYKAHPNNVIYLTSKFRMDTKDIKNILSMIDEEDRQRYDYDNIERLYIEYAAEKTDDSSALQELRGRLGGRKVLALVPGNSLNKYRTQILQYVSEQSPFVIGVNFLTETGKDHLSFYGNAKRYKEDIHRSGESAIVTSNIGFYKDNDYRVDYYGLINRNYKYFDNSAMMLLQLLKKLETPAITIAGFDGFAADREQNYVNGDFDGNRRHFKEFAEMNECVGRMFREFVKTVWEKSRISFLTPSPFEEALQAR